MISGKLLFTICATIILGGCASPREMLGWAKDEPFALTPSEKSEFATSSPVFSKGLGQVAFDMGRVCLGCGDFSDTHTIGIDHINQRLKYDFPALLKQQLAQTTLFPSGDNSLFMRAKLTDITQNSSVGAQAERKSPLTSGAVLTTRISVQYDLLDKGQVVDSWLVTTSARSNSLAASTRLTENIDGALKRNLRALLLRIVADHSPNDATRAKNALASLQSEVDNKRIALAYLVYGATKTVTTTAGVIGDGLVAVAQNSDAVAAGLNSTAATMERSNREYNDAYTKAILARRDQTVGSPGGYSSQNRDSGGESNAKDSGSGAHKDSAKSTAGPNKSTNSSSSTVAGNASGDTERDRSARAEQIAKERAHKDAEEKALADQKRKDQEAQQEQLRQQHAKEKAAREAKEKADALAAKKAEETAKKNYLNAMVKGVHLRATKCPDGEGKYYATGTRPRIKPEVVSCLDVRYRAYCPGSVQYSEGTAHNFIGMSGCFGDTYDINPKPDCKVDQVRIEVVEAHECQ